MKTQKKYKNSADWLEGIAHYFSLRNGFSSLLKVLIVFNLVGLLLIGVGIGSARAADDFSELVMVPMDRLYVEQGQTPAVPVQADILSTRIQSVVTGPIVRTVVSQSFSNSGQDWMEGIYYFPLPDGAAVDRMVLRIGERIIQSEIQERAEAKRTYEKAAAEGRVASLLTQYRPNMFSTRVANIEPGATINVEIAFQTLAEQDGATLSWRMPQAITPRYQPATARSFEATTVSTSAEGSRVDEAGAISREENYSREGGTNPTAFSIIVNGGNRLASLGSPTHQIVVKDVDGARKQVTLKEGALPADRDFVLKWRLPVGNDLSSFLFQEEQDGVFYTLGLVAPPQLDASQTVSPRDVTFVMDVSGSMHGPAIEQGKTALLKALDLLTPQDRFEIIAFDSNFYPLFGKVQSATPEALQAGRDFVSGLEADSGTEMYPALEAALGYGADPAFNRQIMFLTDGAVGNEEEMFSLVERKLGDARLFTVGLGSAPNSWFMRKAAEFGRGIHVHIDNIEAAGITLEKLFEDMTRPGYRNVGLDGAGEAAVYPQALSDMFGERPLIFVAASEQGPLAPTLVAEDADGRAVSFPMKDAEATPQAGIAKYWARKKIEGLMDARARGMDPAIVREAVLDVALKHEIMSEFTSFVAVDKTPARVQQDFLKKVRQSMNMPAGTSWDKIHGLQTATTMELNLLAGLLALGMAGIGMFMYRRSRKTTW
ncbi:marine proteobacterial sortase target protein [Sneathiella chinensis]|nr:marine proteobacterial sortase target protein [Sneathiella chinensis]